MDYSMSHRKKFIAILIVVMLDNIFYSNSMSAYVKNISINYIFHIIIFCLKIHYPTKNPLLKRHHV